MVEAREQTTRVRDEFDRKKNQMLNDLLEKEKKILSLQKKVDQNKKGRKRPTTPGTQVSEEWIEVKRQNYKVLKMCQFIVDRTTRMECARCYNFFAPTDFYEHVTGKTLDGCYADQEDFTMCLEDEVSAIDGGRSPSIETNSRLRAHSQNRDLVGRSLANAFPRKNQLATSMCESVLSANRPGGNTARFGSQLS